MPLYDFKCDNCDTELKDEFVHSVDNGVACPKCCANMRRLFPSTFNAHVFPVGGIHLSNVSPTGETFYSKNEMKKYAREHNMELGALL